MAEWYDPQTYEAPTDATASTAVTPGVDLQPGTWQNDVSQQIPYGVYPWTGQPDYVTQSLQPVFGANTPAGVWGWVQGTMNDWQNASQPAVDTSQLESIAQQMANPATYQAWADAAMAQQRATMRNLETQFAPIMQQYADKTGFTQSTPLAMALRGAMSDLGSQALKQQFDIMMSQQQMQQQGLGQAAEQYKTITDYERDLYLRQLQQLQGESTASSAVANALNQLLYTTRREENPFLPYQAMLQTLA